jgi:hypothetical protein
MPSTPKDIKDGYVHQADLLFLPNDDGYRYALVVVDLGSKKCDAEPLKSKTQQDVKKAFQTIYERGPLSMPKALIQFDQGTEFKTIIGKYFSDNLVMVRRAKVGRHRQQATVEAYNGLIARAIFYDLHEKELASGQTEVKWIHNIKEIISIINDHMKEVRKVERKNLKTKEPSGRCAGKSCLILTAGQRVRIIAEKPEDSTGVKLTGTFRKTDLRWEIPIRTIEEVILKPNQPPLYKINGIRNTNYTFNQLQVVK